MLFIVGAGSIAIPILSQSQEPKLAFEVASVKPNKAEGGSAIDSSPGRFVATGIQLRILIREAYRVRNFQIAGGPNWVNTDRWDIEAKAAE